MADQTPTTPETDSDPVVRRIAAFTKLVQIILPYIIGLGVSLGWWHTSSNNSAQLQVIHSKLDDSAKELKLMTGMNRNANLKG